MPESILLKNFHHSDVHSQQAVRYHQTVVHRKKTLLLLLFLACARFVLLPADSKTASLLEVVSKTRAARLAGDNRSWLEYGKQALALSPDHPDLLISVARALAANGKITESLPLLLDAIHRGAGFDLYAFPEFAKYKEDQTVRNAAQKARANLTAVPRASDFITIDDAGLNPEGITFDPKTRRLFIGSVRGEIWQIDENGKRELFASGNGLHEVYGIKVDTQRRMLWAVTGVFPDLLQSQQTKKDVGSSGLHAYNLDTRQKIVERWLDERPVIHGFNDLALAANGDVYVTDSAKNSVYRLRRGQKQFELLFHSDSFSFPNGIVISADQKRLYVAHVEGISRIELASGQSSKLAVPANAAVNSIDGLAWEGSDLLGIQGSPYLARVIRIRLSADGRAINEVITISSRTPEGYGQTTGAVAGNNFFVLAQLQPADANSSSTQSGAAPARIVRIPLH